jgi:hypothetical protein
MTVTTPATTGETPTPTDLVKVVIDGFAVRFIWNRLAVDAGLLFAFTTGTNVPLPWLDFTWNF